MTTYNTSGDAANTAVRSLLTKIGEYYLQKSFNTSSGYGKHEWNRIKNEGITKIELQNAKTYYKGSFSRNFTSTLSIASLLMIVQYYDLGEDYFDKRDMIIDNLKHNELNNLAKNLFDSETLFFMIVGEPKI